MSFAPGSLAGLGPEDIATISNAATQRQALAQRGIGNVIEAISLESEIAEREARTDLTREQANDLRIFRDPTLKKMAMDLQVSTNLAEKYKWDAEETRQTLQPKIDNILSEIQYRKDLTTIERAKLANQVRESNAQIEAAQAARARQEQLRGQEAQLFPSQLEEAQKRAKGFVELKGIPGLKPEETHTVPTGQMLDYLSQSATRGEQARRFIAGQTQKEADDRRAELKQAEDAEKRLLTLKHRPGVAKSTGGSPAEFQTDLDTFHRYADAPYVYVERKPGYWWNPFGGEARFEQYPIPEVEGERLTSRDIFELAREKNLNVETYMERYIYPRIGQKPPWSQ
jgi:hypothetical protein